MMFSEDTNTFSIKSNIFKNIKWTGTYSEMLITVEGFRINYPDEKFTILWQEDRYKLPSIIKYDSWNEQLEWFPNDDVYSKRGRDLQITAIDNYIHQKGTETWASCLTKIKLN